MPIRLDFMAEELVQCAQLGEIPYVSFRIPEHGAEYFSILLPF